MIFYMEYFNFVSLKANNMTILYKTTTYDEITKLNENKRN